MNEDTKDDWKEKEEEKKEEEGEKPLGATDKKKKKKKRKSSYSKVGVLRQFLVNLDLSWPKREKE